MTRLEVIQKAIEGRITWLQAAVVLGVSSRHLFRLRREYEGEGPDGLRDGRAGRRMPHGITPGVVDKILELRREKYPDFSVRHFHEFITERHDVRVGYTKTKEVLQTNGLAEKAPARGKYRRKRERRPMTGMMVHLDASMHEWVAGAPRQDLVVALDDADGRILYAAFVPEEGTASTFAALEHVLRRYGRFGELYTDRGSHFCLTHVAGDTPRTDHEGGQVSRALRTLGIRQILARSPEARGRSERAFGTLQGRLPQELRAAGITTYAAAQPYLDAIFVPDFNRRFTVEPTEKQTAFVSMRGLDLRLILSSHHDRIVANDHTVSYEGKKLQLPRPRDRHHLVRCTVTVHEFHDGSYGVSFQGRLLAHYREDGQLLVVEQRRA